MLNKNGERELAYIVQVDDILSMNADKLECVKIAGWNCVCSKESFHKGDLGVFFEIDSKLPEVEPFTNIEFLASKKYKIKSQKIRGVISQGLLLPLSEFGWTIEDHPLGTFVTEELKVTYAVAEDNVRKSSTNKYKSMVNRHKWLDKFFITKWMLKYNVTKKILFLFFGNKKKDRNWPYWVKKTDEERIQNMPWVINMKDVTFYITEKIDGTSTTFTLKRHKHFKHKYDYYVCSRNVVFDNPNKKCYYDTNVYLEMSEKFNVRQHLTEFLEEHPEYEWVTLQGETYGEGVQKNDYGIKGRNFAAFNFVVSGVGRIESMDAAKIVTYQWGIPWVPIMGHIDFNTYETLDELIEIADGGSEVYTGPREGFVVRQHGNPDMSFKIISNDYLLKYHS